MKMKIKKCIFLRWEIYFFMDFNENSLFDPQYWYLYDLKKNRKFSVDIGNKAVQLVGWD